MFFPSGDHLKRSAPVDSCVSFFASPPSIESRYTCEFPSREERNARVFPSGDHDGELSCPLCVTCIASPPAVLTIQMLLAPRFASISGVEIAYATHFPSRETSGAGNSVQLDQVIKRQPMLRRRLRHARVTQPPTTPPQPPCVTDIALIRFSSTKTISRRAKKQKMFLRSCSARCIDRFFTLSFSASTATWPRSSPCQLHAFSTAGIAFPSAQI